jgi:hypothetical protein
MRTPTTAAVYRRDPATGGMVPTGETVAVYPVYPGEPGAYVVAAPCPGGWSVVWASCED